MNCCWILLLLLCCGGSNRNNNNTCGCEHHHHCGCGREEVSSDCGCQDATPFPNFGTNTGCGCERN